MASPLDLLPRAGEHVLFAGRAGAIGLPDGRALVIEALEAHLVDQALAPADNGVAVDAGVPRRPAYLDLAPLFGPAIAAPRVTLDLAREVWLRRNDPDGFVRLDPYTGGVIRVAQALRQAAFTPLALSCELRVGDPHDPAVAYQIDRAVAGIADAATMFQLAVVAGDVMVELGRGLACDAIVAVHGCDGDSAMAQTARSDEAAPPATWRPGELVLVAGRMTNDLSGSVPAMGVPTLPPPIDLIAEDRVLELRRQAGSLFSTVRSVGRGGLLVALARYCAGEIGGRFARADAWHALEPAAILFGEAQSRLVATISMGDLPDVEQMARALDVPLDVIGTVGGQRFTWEELIDIDVKEFDKWQV